MVERPYCKLMVVGPLLWISLVGIIGGDQPRQWVSRHGAILGKSLGRLPGAPMAAHYGIDATPQVAICPLQPRAPPQQTPGS